jgi:alpha-galactosidase
MITNGNLSISFHDDFSFTITGWNNLPLAKGHFQFSNGRSVLKGFKRARVDAISNNLGAGVRYAYLGHYGDLKARLTLDKYDSLSDCVVMQWHFENSGTASVTLNSISAPTLKLAAAWAHSLWTMQGAAVHWGQDFAFKLMPGFARDNYLGHIQNGEGGGIPIVYFWNTAGGLSLAHIEPHQEMWYMPASVSKDGTHVAFESRTKRVLNPGDVFETPRVLISVHKGDFFEPLQLYREAMSRQGLKAPEPNTEDFASAWCSWGYEFDVRPSEVVGVLPKLKEMGIRWLTLDDRWFDRYGDWNPRHDTFPNGVKDIKRMNEKIHAAGAFSQIWWYPLCVEDGVGGWDAQTYGMSKTLRNYNHWLVLNADGSVARNNRGLAMLCPGLPNVREYTLALVRKFIRDWDFDGHKLDNIYTMPACHNPAHQHVDPEESVRGFADVYRQIFEVTRQLKPHSVTQICPCGTPLTHTLIPATDQTVTADPTSSAQIRQRIKFYKGLMGARAAVFADHVELSDGSRDFAACLGAGGVLSTKFIYPHDESVVKRLKEDWSLTNDKELAWKKWFDLTNQHSLAAGEYLNLYDLAFDFPEAHAIRIDDQIYYAFFAHSLDEKYSGEIQLRGLDESKKYQIMDYVAGRSFGEVNGSNPRLQVEISGSLLLNATPVEE